MMVGFPGETDDDFGRTVRLCESGLLDYLHVFSYSDRPDTPASKLPDKVDPAIIKERNAILTRVSNEVTLNSHKKQVGQILEVVGEHKPTKDGHYYGVADNYLKVKFKADDIPGREIRKIKIESAHRDYVKGSEIG